jgi:CspA family cold shock protein
MRAGVIVNFNGTRGFGFIAPDDGEDDVFFHANELGGDWAALRSGARVEFDAVERDRGPKAVSVQVLDGSGEVVPVVSAAQPQDDSVCEVVTAEEFAGEIVELLLMAQPA